MGSEITRINNFNSIIRYRKVSKVFGNKLVINDLNLDINRGEIFGLIGGSGAGKTTILKMLIGFIEPEDGKIEIRSNSDHWISMSHDLDEVKSVIGFASQIPSFYGNLTVYENLLYFSSLYKNLQFSFSLLLFIFNFLNHNKMYNLAQLPAFLHPN